MSEYGDLVQEKCLAFGDRIVKLNDYLLKEAANQKAEVRWLMEDGKRKKVTLKPVPVYLQSISNICNQLLRSGTSIGANNAEAINAVSKQDFRAKSYIALKEARESLYWIELLRDNGYLDPRASESLLHDCGRINKILITITAKVRKRLSGAKD